MAHPGAFGLKEALSPGRGETFGKWVWGRGTPPPAGGGGPLL